MLSHSQSNTAALARAVAGTRCASLAPQSSSRLLLQSARPHNVAEAQSRAVPQRSYSGRGAFAARRDQLNNSAWEPVVGSKTSEEVVPLYYVERKRSRSTISGRKEQEGDLMCDLSAGILHDGFAAETRRLIAKIPSEHRLPVSDMAAKPRVQLRDRNPLIQTAAVLERVQEESDLKEAIESGNLNANTRRLRSKIPYEVRECDGIIRHASGYIPPTPIAELMSKRPSPSSPSNERH